MKKPLILKVKKISSDLFIVCWRNVDLSYLHGGPTSATFFSERVLPTAGRTRQLPFGIELILIIQAKIKVSDTTLVLLAQVLT